jgi:flagellar FliL protein
MATGEVSAGEGGGPGEKPSGLLGFIIAMLVATVVSGVGGGIFGMYGLSSTGPSSDTKQEKAKAKDAAKQAFGDGLNLKALSPIITNLGGPKAAWIRLEAAIVVVQDGGKEDNVLAGKITEDIVAYLRTVPMGQIEGANGFQNLREDLNERARIRSGGRVREVVIQSLVVE